MDVLRRGWGPWGAAHRGLALVILVLWCLVAPVQAQSPQPLSAPHSSAGASNSEAPDSEMDAMTLWTGGRYRLTQSDVLDLHFPHVPEFDQTVTVQPDGYISLRGLNDLYVLGRSLPELRAQLVEAYAGIIRQPVISVVLREFEKPYFIAAGEVARPGKFELRGATTVTQGLVLAGGPTGSAKHSQVLLFRRFVSEWLEVKEINVKKMYASRDLSEDMLLRSGDTIFVPKRALSKIAPFIPRPGLGFYFNPFQ
jgi:polysaccharide biosynthesis/export protein